jgi:purine nucleosidase
LRHVLIDTDAGVDDALAIALALASPELAVERITTVSGNVSVGPSTRNVLMILETLFPASRVPVAQGAAAPLAKPLETASHVHGTDGLGNITDMRLPDGSPKYPNPSGKVVDMPASRFIIDQVRRLGGDLTIVTLGPLTNIAIAINEAPDVMKHVGEIIIMGGAFGTSGNTSPVAEFNIFVDPDAANAVVEFDVPKTIVPLDVTEQVILLRSELETRFSASPSQLIEFLRDVSSFYMDFHRKNDGFDGCHMHDPTTVALAIDPTLAKTVPAEVHVECNDDYKRGKTVADLDPERLSKYRPNAKVCVEIDARRTLDLFFSNVVAWPGHSI